MRVRAGGVRGWDSLILFARAEWRVRWRSDLVVVGLGAATVAATVATLTGAIRSETAFHRLRAATHASDAVVFDPNTQSDPAAAVAAVEAVAGVESAAAKAEVFVRPAGTEFFPDYNLYPFARLGADHMDAPVIIAGREVVPSRPDEVTLSEGLGGCRKSRRVRS